jgi:nucleosome binding factor SPN SPT16 subunit
MSEAIKIDNKLFQERISHFINAWKADKRSGDALFGGASSIIVMMGKMEEVQGFQKNNAMHVSLVPAPADSPFSQTLGPSTLAWLTYPFLQFWLLGYEFPTTLMLFTTETLYILTTQKKGVLPPTRHGGNK